MHDKRPFKLSKTNIVYLAIIAILFGALPAIGSGGSAVSIGTTTGRITAIFVFPTFFAWLAWLLMGRKAKGGNITFNVVLTLIAIGQVNSSAQRAQQRSKLQELQGSHEAYRSVIASSESSEDVEVAYGSFQTSMQQGLRELAENATGDDRLFYEGMGRFFRLRESRDHRWLAAQNSVAAERILDFSLLKNTGELSYQRTVIEAYIEEVSSYRTFLQEAVALLQAEFEGISKAHSLTAETIAGLQQAQSDQAPYIYPLLDAHIKYGTTMLAILKLLEADFGDWHYDNDEFEFSDGPLETTLTEHLDLLGQLVEQMNELTRQLALAGQ